MNIVDIHWRHTIYLFFLQLPLPFSRAHPALFPCLNLLIHFNAHLPLLCLQFPHYLHCIFLPLHLITPTVIITYPPHVSAIILYLPRTTISTTYVYLPLPILIRIHLTSTLIIIYLPHKITAIILHCHHHLLSIFLAPLFTNLEAKL